VQLLMGGEAMKLVRMEWLVELSERLKSVHVSNV
jgi:hypothetical protein